MMKNKEDFRFITGRGNYVDDVRLPGTLYASFVRSPYAHAAIKGIDTSEALKVPGVKLILTGPDLAKNLPPLFPTQGGPGMKKYTRCALSIGKVRCVGEPVAAVIADDRYIAEDG
ncbi:MAG: xanthine dehydrogenase family protein molybdopterin-binding subunit, partial [Nitrososphaerales archaeon]